MTATSMRDLRDATLTGVWAAVRTASVELWFHPWPSLAANVAWFVPALGVALLATVWPLGGLLLVPLLALPTASAYRLAGRIVRGHGAVTGDGFEAWRSHWARVLGLGLGVVLVVVVLGVDLVVGLTAVEGPVGWALATAAAWALAAAWVWLLHVWPLLLDPATDRTLRAAARDALTVVMVFPGRAVRLALVSAVAAVAATILFAALATFAVVWLALLGSAVVLPAADRIAAATGIDPGAER